MKLQTTIFTFALLGGLSVSSLASAATGDSFVSGNATLVPIFAYGNNDAQFTLFCAATGSYIQDKVPSESHQTINLSASGKIYASAKVFGQNYTAIDLTASSSAFRQGNHLTGDSHTKIVVRNITVFNRTNGFDQNTGFTNLEAPLSREERVYNIDEDFTAQFVIGPVPVAVTGNLSGSVSVRTNSNAAFMVDNGRKGTANGTSAGIARADVKVTFAAGVPSVFAIGLYAGLNLFTLDYPVTGVSTWNASSSFPLAERNHYATVAVLNLNGETAGGSFGLSLTGAGGFLKYEKEFARWDSFKIFDKDIKRKIASDVGAEE